MMVTELDDRLKELAGAWDAAASPVTAGEARARGGLADVDAAVVSLPGAAHGRRRRWPILAVVVAAAAATIAVVSMVHDDPRPSISPSGSELPDAASTTAPATSIEPTTAPSTTPSVDAQLADISASVTAALSTFDSFRATATLHTISHGIPSDPTVSVLTNEHTLVNTITLFGNGSMWSEGDQFLWTGYDATTGVSRAAYASPDGATAYQEVVGWSDNSTPLLIMLGRMPTMQFEGLPNPTVEEVTSHLGRPAWLVTTFSGFANDGSADPTAPGYMSQTDEYTIDQQTGLLIRFRGVNTHDGVEDLTEMRLDNLVVDVEMPAGFPGVFPEGAVVDRSGDPIGFVPLTIEQAATQFGFGFVTPVIDDEQPRVWVVEQGRTFDEAGNVTGTMRTATIEWYEGFVKSSVGVTKTIPTEGVPPEDGYAIVDGLLCWTIDGVHCIGTDEPSDITAGALAGVPSMFEGSWLTISNGPVQITINASSPEAALAIANSLITVEF